LSLFRFRRVAEFFLFLGHDLLEALARFGPSFLIERNGAFALALALVLAGAVSAAAKAAAGVVAGAGVLVDGEAGALAGAVVFAALSFALARVQAAADMRLLQERIDLLVLGLGFVVFLVLGAEEVRPGQDAAEGGRGELVEITSIHGFSLVRESLPVPTPRRRSESRKIASE